MPLSPSVANLPLRYPTPPKWSEAVLKDPLALLNDHAHLEKKAAANALELLNRWPEPAPPENWVSAMSAIARDEAEHLGVVTRLLARRGGRLTRTHRNPYANDLRTLVRSGEGPRELLDRLLVSSLIEVRSCERFCLLAETSDDRELTKLYRGLWASEHGHYLMFLKLGESVCPAEEVAERWDVLLDEEARIAEAQPAGPRMHSGCQL